MTFSFILRFGGSPSHLLPAPLPISLTRPPWTFPFPSPPFHFQSRVLSHLFHHTSLKISFPFSWAFLGFYPLSSLRYESLDRNAVSTDCISLFSRLRQAKVLSFRLLFADGKMRAVKNVLGSYLQSVESAVRPRAALPLFSLVCSPAASDEVFRNLWLLTFLFSVGFSEKPSFGPLEANSLPFLVDNTFAYKLSI